jgi:hypothetical protein
MKTVMAGDFAIRSVETRAAVFANDGKRVSVTNARRNPSLRVCVSLTISVFVASCTGEPTTDLTTDLKGIDEAKFLSCSGSPAVSFSQGGQDRMSFVTDLRRGAMIGISNVASPAVASCSVDAIFEQHKLVQATFSGDSGMCSAVFSPCVTH